MMHLLFALGQHAALTAIQGSPGAQERLIFLDDLYVATPIPDRLPERVRNSAARDVDALPHPHQRRQDPGVEFWWTSTQIL